MHKNGKMWYDTDGNEIQAHGGCIINYNGTYYWYGENKNGVTKNRRMDFIGFSCYSSKDLVNWKAWKGEPLIKSECEWENRHAHKSCVIKENGVVYHYYCAVNDKNERFIALATSKEVLE